MRRLLDPVVLWMVNLTTLYFSITVPVEVTAATILLTFWDDNVSSTAIRSVFGHHPSNDHGVARSITTWQFTPLSFVSPFAPSTFSV